MVRGLNIMSYDILKELGIFILRKENMGQLEKFYLNIWRAVTFKKYWAFSVIPEDRTRDQWVEIAVKPISAHIYIIFVGESQDFQLPYFWNHKTPVNYYPHFIPEFQNNLKIK